MEIPELLDQLAEFESQAAYLNLKKQELLDAVKVPEEVLAAQNEANKRRQMIDSETWALSKAYAREKQEALSEIVDPEMPAEFVAAIEAVRQKRAAIDAEYRRLEEEDQCKAAELKAKIDAELQVKVSDVYRQVQTRKAEITAEFASKEAGVAENIDELTKRIKAEVKAYGQTVKATHYQAVYVKGRVTWNTDMLDGMIIAFPQLEKARKVGEPSVTLRKVG